MKFYDQDDNLILAEDMDKKIEEMEGRITIMLVMTK